MKPEGAGFQWLFWRERLPLGRFCLFLVLSLGLLYLDQGANCFKSMRAMLSTLMLPLQISVQKPFAYFEQFLVKRQQIEELRFENALLKHQQFLQEGRLQRLLAIESENARLRALLQSTPRRSVDYQVAEVIQWQVNRDRHRIVLNKGTQAGVYIGQAVIDSEGILGKVVSVAPFSSVVLLLTDRMHAIPVENLRTQTRGVAQGSSQMGRLHLQYVMSENDIQENDLMISSGLGGQYPYGYPVGRVKAIRKRPGEPFLSFVLQPSARLDRIREVLLLRVTDTNKKQVN